MKLNKNEHGESQVDSIGKIPNGSKNQGERPALRVVEPSQVADTPRLEVDFKHLNDGRIVELVEDPADATKTKLAVFDSGKISYADAVDYRGQVLVPIGRTTHGLEDIILPSAPRPYQSGEEVFYHTCNLLAQCVSLPPVYLLVTSAVVLNSWFADRLQPPIYLLVTGPPQSGKTTLLQVMRLLCRRPLLVSEITPAAANEVCSRFGATLLLDENDWRSDKNTRALRKQLRAGTSKGVLAKYLGKTQHTFGTKILSSIELPGDAALRSRCIHVPMDESNQVDLKKPWDPQVVKTAHFVRGQLLHYRLEQYASVYNRCIPGTENLRPRSRDLFSSLVGPLKGPEALEQMLLYFFLGVHDPSTRDLLSPTQAAVAAALFDFIHVWPFAGHIQVSMVAEKANKILDAAGERFKLNPRKCSDLLASLGFSSRVRSSQGSQVCLDKEAIAKIHKLKRNYGNEWPASIPLMATTSICEFCKDEGR